MSVERQLFKLCDELFEKKDDNTKEKIKNKTNRLFSKANIHENQWHLYQILISTNGNIVETQLGFLVPLELIELPVFRHEDSKVLIVFLKLVNYNEYRHVFERFSRHLFEHVFDYTDNVFDIQQSSFKLLPCLLNCNSDSNDIDFHRMMTICQRYEKPIEHSSLLSNIELYTVEYLSTKPLLIYQSTIQRSSDRKIPFKQLHQFKLDLTKRNHPFDLLQPQLFYYPIESLRYAPLNQQDFCLIIQLPILLVRIVQLYHIEKLRTSFAKEIPYYSLNKPIEVKFKDCLTEYIGIISFVFSHDLFLWISLNYLTYDFSVTNHAQPSSELLFQAMTRRSTHEQFDMENLEILGDCFLKLAVSMSLYYSHSTASVGELSERRKIEISNENLYRLIAMRDLKDYLYKDEIIFRKIQRNWLPPGYMSTSERFTQQEVKRKAFADMLEAFIGAFLMSSNFISTIQFMKSIGLNVIPVDNLGQIMQCSISIPTIEKEKLRRIYVEERFDDIEKQLNYCFRDKIYLVLAFTHPSISKQSYERLEFFGDALLDFLVIRHAFLNYERDVTPGRITAIRRDLSNNNRLAEILVSSNLHTKIRFQSTGLSQQIQSYLTKFHQSTDQNRTLIAPKIFADVFEALIGGLFFDSNNSLEILWKILEPFLVKYFNRTISSI